MRFLSEDTGSYLKLAGKRLAGGVSAFLTKSRTPITLAISFLTFVGAVNAQQKEFYLRNGDRVVFYGDSITEQLLYTTFIETFVVTRFPEMEVTFVNAGWSGDRVSGGHGGQIDLRLKRDVIDHRPSVITIMLGMNDGNVAPYDSARFDTFASGYRYIIKTLKEARPGLRMTLIKPSPYDDVTRAPLFAGGYNAVLVRYGEFVAGLAREFKVDYADLNTSVIAALEKANAADSTIALRIIPDRVHPRPAGHLLMAKALLQAWKAPSVVWEVEIDVEKARVTRAVNTTISDLSNKIDITWTQRDRSLPMPLDLEDQALALAVESGNVIETLNRQILKVTGLTAAHYTLKIDDEEVAILTRETLSEGVNLSTLPTPMLKQARDVHSLTISRNHIQFAKWRELQFRFQGQSSPALEQARAGLNALESDLYVRQRALAKPKMRHFKLVVAPIKE